MYLPKMNTTGCWNISRQKNNKDYYFFIKVLGTTGARLSEFQQFTWEDIISGEVTLKGKGTSTDVFLPKAIAAGS